MENNKFNLLSIVNTVAPSFESIETEVSELKRSYASLNRHELADKYANRLRSKYTSVGVASALPSVIPGVGTAVQLAVEAGTISGDLALMLRWTAATCYGVAHIFEKDIRSEFNQEYVVVLGRWCGAIKIVKDASVRFGQKAGLSFVTKNISGKVLREINKRVGFTLLTKFGTKRGGIALGKLIPFGVGAAISGAFNFSTMSGFKKSAIEYFGDGDDAIYAVAEEVN